MNIHSNFIHSSAKWKQPKCPAEGDKNITPQNKRLWHIDYYELKALEKQQLQEGMSDLPFPPKSVSYNFP